MNSKLLMIMGVLALAIAAMAPSASASTVTYTNFLGEPSYEGETVELRGEGDVSMYLGGAFACEEFSLNAQIGSNQSDPMTMDNVSGVLRGSSGDPEGPCVIAGTYDISYEDIASTGDLALNTDGTGELPIEMRERRQTWWGEWDCVRSGVIPLTWTNNSGYVDSQTAYLAGEGSCHAGSLTIESQRFELIDEFGEPATLVLE